MRKSLDISTYKFWNRLDGMFFGLVIVFALRDIDSIPRRLTIGIPLILAHALVVTALALAREHEFRERLKERLPNDRDLIDRI